MRRTCKLALVVLLSALSPACRQGGPVPSRPQRAAEGPDAARPLPSPLPDVVARVNGQPISASLLRFVAEAAGPNEQAKKPPRAYRRALDELIARELLFQEALARNVRVDSARVDAAFDEARARYPDEEQWRSFLARRGADVAAFRLDVRAQQTIAALSEAERAKAGRVSEGEALAHYEAHAAELALPERVRVRHILVRAPQGGSAAERSPALTRARELVRRLRKGADFARLAREASDDPESSKQGGLRPEMAREHMAEALAEAVSALAPGAVSDPIDTPQGFEIVRLEERLPARALSYDEVRPRLLQMLTERRQQEAITRLVDELWSKAAVEILI